MVTTTPMVWIMEGARALAVTTQPFERHIDDGIHGGVNKNSAIGAVIVACMAVMATPSAWRSDGAGGTGSRHTAV